MDFDLNFIDAFPPCYYGLNEEFICSPRMDNLVSSFLAIKTIINADSMDKDSSFINMITLFDHEECGSQSF